MNRHRRTVRTAYRRLEPTSTDVPRAYPEHYKSKARQHKNLRENPMQNKMKLPTDSPYTAQNVDAAIAHLERVLSAEGARSLFGQTYWRARLMQVHSTPGLTHTQRGRLHRLIDVLSKEIDGPAVRRNASQNITAERARF